MADKRPGNFFDLQVNGYAGVDFNADDLTVEQLHHACERLAADGVDGILATLITDDVGRMAGRLGRLAVMRAESEPARRIIAGFHVEGPFINETDGFRGAHPREFVRPADVDDAKRLLDAGGGLVRLVTLAPERDAGLTVTRMLTQTGVVVSAGHCDASIDELHAAVDAGLTMFTHLGNGCPPELPRHDNIIQRVLSFRDRLWITFIADGVHIPFFALGNLLRAVGAERAIVVTDAMAAAGLGPGKYRLGQHELTVGEDMIARTPEGHLAGSTAHMPRMADNLRRRLGLSDDTVRRLTSINPKRAVMLETSPEAPVA